jgi:hypothetical protein
LALSVVGVLAAEVPAPRANVVRIDGTALAGQWLGGRDTSIQFRTETGETQLAVDELSSIRFETADQIPNGDAVFHLADGGRLLGNLTGGEGNSVVAHTAVSGSLRLLFETLAGIRLVQGEELAKSAELFDAALQSRLPGQDVLISRGPDEVKALRGRLESLDAQSGSFVYGDRPRSFQNDNVYGFVFAVGIAKPDAFPLTVELAEGSSFSGALETSGAENVNVRASFGLHVSAPLNQVKRLLFRSPRVVYVSDLKPASERVEGQVHRPWPVRKDRSASAKSLSIAGRVFDKGLGVHSRTELSYQIAGDYESFVATIGIDDAVRPRGSVVFRVSGDGRELFDSGEVRGSDPPRDIQVDVKDVKSLTLAVDYGEALDVSDHANWGGARLLKAAAKAKEK